MVLLPKRDGAQEVADFRPICLIHSIPKLVSKMLASRLAPVIHKLVTHNQSAFIRGRSIQDNFLYVRNVIKAAHTAKSPMVFLKLDIAKAFDSVWWVFLLEVMEAMGFGQRWRDMISLMLSSSSSRVLLNGVPGVPFHHRCGLRQGDSLSPLLFILAMEPLQRLLQLATERNILSRLRPRVARFRSSFYADDAALFINPVADDFNAVHAILTLFGDASGLRTNVTKSVAYPIACANIDMQPLFVIFGGEPGAFPCQYLGLPLGTRKPRRVELQPLIDKIAGRLSNRRGRMMNRMGRLVYINSVVTATATYYLTAPDKWLIKKVDKLRKNFLWDADDGNIGGKSLVNWRQVCTPKRYGGLGVKNIECFGRALRLRWEWFRWGEEDRPWKGSDTPCNSTDKQLFASCTRIQLGDGNTAFFWTDRWLNGEAFSVSTPELFKLARFKKLTVKQGLHNNKWMTGLHSMNSEEQLTKFFQIWDKVQVVTLEPRKDKVVWNLTANGVYSCTSAYEAQFFTRIHKPELSRVWRGMVEGKVRFYLWLLLQNRNWTADRLQARGWPHDALCSLCDQELETTNHLSLHCSFAKVIWDLFRRSTDDLCSAAATATSISEWWEHTGRGRGSKDRNKEEMTLAAYIVWNLWKERNRRVFEHKEMGPLELAASITDEVNMVKLAMSRGQHSERR